MKLSEKIKEMRKKAKNFKMSAAQMQAVEKRARKFKSLCAGSQARMMTAKQIDNAGISARLLMKKLEG